MCNILALTLGLSFGNSCRTLPCPGHLPSGLPVPRGQCFMDPRTHPLYRQVLERYPFFMDYSNDLDSKGKTVVYDLDHYAVGETVIVVALNFKCTRVTFW